MFGNFGQCAYAAAKEGIRGLTRVAATEWAADGINVNVVCPLAWTAQLENFEKAYPEAYKANVKVPPMGRFGEVEEIMGATKLLISEEEAAFITGVVIPIDGGFNAYSGV